MKLVKNLIFCYRNYRELLRYKEMWIHLNQKVEEDINHVYLGQLMLCVKEYLESIEKKI